MISGLGRCHTRYRALGCIEEKRFCLIENKNVGLGLGRMVRDIYTHRKKEAKTPRNSWNTEKITQKQQEIQKQKQKESERYEKRINNHF